MARNAAALAVVKSGFADQQEKVELEFENNEVFRNLCEEFEQCSSAIEHWKNNETADAEQRAQEYVDLLAELRQEIETWLLAMV